jgi:hypothetical protein
MLLAHLNLIAGDFVCSADHQQSPEAAADASPPPEHHHGGGAPVGESSSTSECKIPVRARCCEALTSCTVSVVFAGAVAQVPLTGSASKISPASTLPLSLFSPPETPPPKA